MRRPRFGLLFLLVASATLVVSAVSPSEWQRAGSAALLLLAGAAVLDALAALRQRAVAPRRAPAVDDPPVQLAAAARAIAAAERSPREFERQLRPYLRALAAARLARRGVAIDDRAPARELLGDDLWDLLARDGEMHAVHRDGGLRVESLREALDRLAAL
jgi:hypothetical protein